MPVMGASLTLSDVTQQMLMHCERLLAIGRAHSHADIMVQVSK